MGIDKESLTPAYIRVALVILILWTIHIVSHFDPRCMVCFSYMVVVLCVPIFYPLFKPMYIKEARDC